MGVRKSDRTDGIGAIIVTAGLSQAKFTTAEQAYQDYIALINAFRQAGWNHYVRPMDARIAKEDNIKILTHHNSQDTSDGCYIFNTGYSSDSLAHPSFQEWRSMIEGQQYKFSLNLRLYLRDVNVIINIYQTKTKPNPLSSQPDLEQYMVKMRFYTAKYQFYQSDRDGKTLEQKQQEYNQELEGNTSIRQDREACAKKAGFTINESYQDPDMWQYIIEPAY